MSKLEISGPKLPINNEFPAELLRAFRKSGSGVIAFVGSGPSCEAGLPAWSEVLLQVARQVGLESEIDGHVQRGNLIQAAEFLSARRSEKDIQERVVSLLKQPPRIPGSIHNLVTELPFSGIITTNYDLLLTRADVSRRFELPITQRTSGLRSKLQERFVLHLHGHLDDPDTIILSRNAYDHILLHNDAVRQFITTVFHTRIVLFIGFGFADPHIDNLLRDLQDHHVLGGATVFALLTSPRQFDFVRDENLRSRAINPIYVSQGKDHGAASVHRWLRRLRRVVRRIRLSEEKSVEKICSPRLMKSVIALLSQDEWSSRFAQVLSLLPDRPDLAHFAIAGIRQSDLNELITRIAPDELRTALMFMNEIRRNPELEDALSCLPPG